MQKMTDSIVNGDCNRTAKNYQSIQRVTNDEHASLDAVVDQEHKHAGIRAFHPALLGLAAIFFVGALVLLRNLGHAKGHLLRPTSVPETDEMHQLLTLSTEDSVGTMNSTFDFNSSKSESTISPSNTNDSNSNIQTTQTFSSAEKEVGPSTTNQQCVPLNEDCGVNKRFPRDDLTCCKETDCYYRAKCTSCYDTGQSCWLDDPDCCTRENCRHIQNLGGKCKACTGWRGICNTDDDCCEQFKCSKLGFKHGSCRL